MIDDVFDAVAEMLIDGRSVKIPNFGCFDLEIYPETQIKMFGRGPVDVPERNILKFRPAVTLKKLIAIGEHVEGRVVGVGANS